MKPKISVLIANYNKAPYVKEAISSIINQDFKNWELIIIDDGSTDNSVNVIKEFLNNEQVFFFQNKKNVGKIKTLEELELRARGEIMAILDSDDALREDALFEIVDACNNHPDCGFFYTQCYYCDEKLKPMHLGFSAQIPDGKSNLHVNSVVALRAHKKEAFLKSRGYDKDVVFAEDIDLTLKMEEITNLFFINKPLYYYRILPHSQTHSFRNTQINRSSTALAKFKAYKRRLNTQIPNLNNPEIAEVLFLGIFTSILSGRLSLFKKFIIEIFIIHPLFVIDLRFYFTLFKKIIKILKIKLKTKLL